MFPALLTPRCDADCLKEPARAAASCRPENIISALRVTVFPRFQLGLLRRPLSKSRSSEPLTSPYKINRNQRCLLTSDQLVLGAIFPGILTPIFGRPFWATKGKTMKNYQPVLKLNTVYSTSVNLEAKGGTAIVAAVILLLVIYTIRVAMAFGLAF